MFKHIFSFEFNQWFNKPLFYVYALVLAGIGALSMAATGGLFDSNTATVSSLTWINSPIQLCYSIGVYSYLAYFLLPSVVGATVHKDFSSNMHKVLYSYPFEKRAYFFGKFWSSFLIMAILLLLIGLGTQLGTTISGVDQSIVAPFSLKAYLLTYGLWVLPTLFLFSAIVFAVTLYTRSIIAGFIVLAVLFFAQGIADTLLADQDYNKIGAIADPFGFNAINYYAKYWTIVEQNENMIPVKGVILINRALWIGISLFIFLWTYVKFTFSYSPVSWQFWKKKKIAAPSIASKPSIIQDVSLPAVSYSRSFLQSLKSAVALTKIDLKYVLSGGPFIVISIIGVLFIVMLSAFGGELFGTKTLPVTRELLLVPGGVFRMFIILLTFIYAGLLIHRPESVSIYQLEDATETPTWSFILSRVLTLVIMQMALLGIIMLTGIALQIYNGYYNFELGLYITDLFGIRLIGYVIWALFAILIYSLIPNFYAGLFTLLIISIGMNFLGRLGVEQDIFKYNDGPGVSYSDMAGYGRSLGRYFTYKVYWFSMGLVFLFFSSMLWRRGVRTGFLSMLKAIPQRATRWSLAGVLTGLIAFAGIGRYIYVETNVKQPYVTSKMAELERVNIEKEYKRYELMPHPRLVDVTLDLNLYPETQDIEGGGQFIFVNKGLENVDTILVNDISLTKEITFDKRHSLVIDDTAKYIQVYSLSQSLAPGDSITMTFRTKNDKNQILRSETPVRANGTFFNNYSFPRVGYEAFGELSDDKTRRKYGLATKERMASPTDSIARLSNYISNNADWINFKATVSTSEDQIAMVPGQLTKEWQEDGRNYFSYEMQSKMLNFYNIISGRYEKYEDEWRGLPVTIYYHKGHDYNLERIMKGAKAGLDYCNDNFSPYQHRQLRILEFPSTGGSFAQSFANTIPFSESVGFIADVDDSEDGGVDFPFAISAHEVAHQWWAHQVIGANTQGATMLSESLSEYVSLQVLKHTYGEDKMRVFLKDALDKYLLGRTVERKKERPLMLNENQQHIHYQKGSLVFYAISDYWGEDNLNAVLSAYVDSVGFQEPPYTTSLELTAMLKEAMPDSLQYLIEDMIETITLYNNRITEATYDELGDGNYEVSFSTQMTKYRTGEKGRRQFKTATGDSLVYQPEGKSKPIESLPLADYVDIGVFGVDDEGNETVLYLRKHKISEIHKEWKIKVSGKPVDVGIDPYNKLIDTNSEDNRKKPEKAN